MLRLVEEQPGLWERFQREPSQRSPLVLDAPQVFTRWQRSRELGVAADGTGHPLGVADHDLSVRRDAALGALREGTQVIEALEARVAGHGLLTVVTDATGVIVRARGGDAFPDEVRRTRLVEGARWDEGARGTNAIGTAIVEAQPVGVVGRAHFESVNHGLFCYAAPVLDVFGEVVAVIDVTGPLSLDASDIAAAVREAARHLDALVRARAYAESSAGSRSFLERMMDRSASAALLIEAPGRVRRMNAAAESELERLSEPSVEHLFGLSWSELLGASRAGRATFETPRRRFEVAFEPVTDRGGRTLAMVCFLEQQAPRSRPRSALPDAEPLPRAFATIAGSDAQLACAKSVAARLARSEVPLLLLAETGTGKELFARAIHRASRRTEQPFVAVNCGALSGSLLESELFGYAPGAFTGAHRLGAEGKLSAAHGGTLFLDEIAEMPAATQAMLLRFLEDGSYTRIGDAQPRRANVRLLAATCRDLPRLVAEGTFRSDLFYRVHGGSVRLPPLRQRTDRLELARALVASAATAQGIARPPALAPSAEAWILDHRWPGNVRELKTALQHALAMSQGGALEAHDFPEPLITELPAAPRDAEAPRQRALRSMAEAAVERASGNMSEAARALGVARSTLYRMLRARRRS